MPNVSNNFYTINEAFLINIPSVAIVDTIDNPLNVFFPIPGNAKSIKSLFLLYLLVTKGCFYSRYFCSSSFFLSFTRKLKFFNTFLKSRDYLKFYFNFLVKDKVLSFLQIIFYSILNLNLKKISKFKFFNKVNLNYYLNSLFLTVFKLNSGRLNGQKKYSSFLKSLMGIIL